PLLARELATQDQKAGNVGHQAIPAVVAVKPCPGLTLDLDVALAVDDHPIVVLRQPVGDPRSPVERTRKRPTRAAKSPGLRPMRPPTRACVQPVPARTRERSTALR